MQDPLGESVAMLKQRTLEALREHEASGQHTLVVTHSGVIKSALSSGDAQQDFNTVTEFGGIVNYSGLDQ